MGVVLKSDAKLLYFGLIFLLGVQLLPAKEKSPEPYALLFGTCFDGRGFSLPGANVLVELVSQPAVKVKKKRWEIVSSPRGEFAVRLPVGRNTFKVAATKPGFKPAEKTVSFEADERQDIILSLEAVPANK